MLEASQSAIPASDTRKTKILIADDETDIRRLFAFVFRDAGYEVLTARDGAEALRMAQQQTPDLLLLDVMMPEIDGLEVCWRLRDIPETAHLPIIMISAKGQVPDKVSGLHAGADDYLVKPVSTDELLARVAVVLHRTQQGAARSQEPRRARVIGFIGAKGGVGTTTTVLNAGTLLALQRKSVIAVEMQPVYGTFALHLRWHGGENLSHLVNRELDEINDRAVKARLYAPFSGLRVLYGPQKAQEFCDLDAGRVSAVIERTASMAEYVLLDLPTGATAANQAAAKACDLVIVVMESEPTCLYCAKVMIELLRIWGIVGALVGVVLVNRSGLPGNVGLRDLGVQLGSEIIGIVPFANDVSVGAAQNGLPMVLFKPDHNVTAAFKEMVHRLTAEPLMGLRI